MIALDDVLVKEGISRNSLKSGSVPVGQHFIQPHISLSISCLSTAILAIIT